MFKKRSSTRFNRFKSNWRGRNVIVYSSVNCCFHFKREARRHWTTACNFKVTNQLSKLGNLNDESLQIFSRSSLIFDALHDGNQPSSNAVLVLYTVSTFILFFNVNMLRRLAKSFPGLKSCLHGSHPSVALLLRPGHTVKLLLDPLYQLRWRLARSEEVRVRVIRSLTRHLLSKMRDKRWLILRFKSKY